MQNLKTKVGKGALLTNTFWQGVGGVGVGCRGTMWHEDLSSPSRNEPVPLQWKHRVLITALSGKSTNRIKSYDLIWVYVVHRVSGCLPIKIPGIEVGTSALAYKDFSQ